ncbi:MAG: MFS transporter [Thermoleophilia bacterium]
MRRSRYNWHVLDQALTVSGSPRLRAVVLAVVVGVVLADSSVVILALSDILTQFNVSVAHVAWVLTAYNLVLGLAAVPSAFAARRWPRGVFAAGAVLFGAGSLACALTHHLWPLVGMRCVQALGGAMAVCAALHLLPAVTGSRGAATRLWAIAGAVGMAVGPAVGGALTQLISWRSIFILQVPLAAAALVVAGIPHLAGARGAAVERPHWRANAGLLLVSAGLTAALFLVVLLMIEGWRLRPLTAAVAVSVMPAAAVIGGRLMGHIGSVWARASAGALGVGLGLCALAIMPGASIWWTVAPQLLVGMGLALAVPALTQAALADRAGQEIHGGITIMSRHMGVVLGILLLTPIFVADMNRQQSRAENAMTAALLDAKLDVSTKLALADAGERVLASQEAGVPDITPAFRSIRPSAADRPAYEALRVTLQHRIARAATASVARSFFVAAAMALLALLPLLWSRFGRRAVT